MIHFFGFNAAGVCLVALGLVFITEVHLPRSRWPSRVFVACSGSAMISVGVYLMVLS